MGTSPSLRISAYRARQRERGAPDTSRRYRKEYRRAYKQSRGSASKSFVGCDGEGCGVDAVGRQLYMLFRMGGRELFTGAHLRTEEILDFICDEPRDSLLVGFSFGYDVTMILRDLSARQQVRLFEPKTFEEGHSPFTWYKTFDIDYLPKQYLRVFRVRIERDEAGNEKRVRIKGSGRTIYETFGFFQKSFLKTITEFEVGSLEQRKMIATNKDKRENFTEITQEVRDYCALECQFLAELMEKLREYCYAVGIYPSSWNGAGKLAAALHKLHETPKGKDVASGVSPALLDYANMAYYGGRFEITRTGQIKEPVYEYDIRSAYPDAMRYLPCLVHGVWKEASAADVKSHRGLFVAGCEFKTSDPTQDRTARLGGLPIRSKEGHLYWPLSGAGIYWSPEIRSAEKLGFKIKLKSGWTYHSHCDCKTHDWVEMLFEYRKSIGSSGPGYPIKLGINSLYGKYAQRKGNGVYCNMIWAGLITALTRTKLNEAVALNPGRIVMLATDAIYSLDPLELDCGEKLGQWEMSKLDGLFIVQPGLYWCPAKRKKKSRGLSGKFFEEDGRTQSFEKAWQQFMEQEKHSKLITEFPIVKVPVPGFIGMKLAVSRNKPELAGRWIKDERVISFDYRNKRQGHTWEGEAIVTSIKTGSPGLVSLPHREFLAAGGHEPWELARAMLEEQPDYVDLGIPFKD